MIAFGLRPVDQLHRVVGLACGDLHRHAITQQLVGAQVGLIGRDAGDVHRDFQLLQGGVDMGGRITACAQIGAQQVAFDGAVVVALAPVAQVFVAQAAGVLRGGEQIRHAVL